MQRNAFRSRARALADPLPPLFDEDGFIIDSSLWTEQLAPTIAAEEGIAELTATGCDIVHKHKGTLWATLTSRGTAAHGSKPELGDNAIMKLLPLLQALDTDFPEEDKFDHLAARPKARRGPNAFLTVQEGCDKFCAFCVVPYTRGAEVSRPAARVMAEARDLVVTLPTRAALLARDNAELVMLEPPFEIPEIELKMAWSPLLHHNPAHRWLRGVIAEVAQKVDA